MITKQKATIAKTEKKIESFDEQKFAAIEVQANNKWKKKVALEKKRVEKEMKEQDFKSRKAILHQKAVYRTHRCAADQLAKDMSQARKAHQNHQYVIAYCEICKNQPKGMKIVKPTNGHFPKVE